MIESVFTISGQHPSLPGHFPGNAIVPGVVILEQVIQGIKKQMSDFQLTAIPSVKFLKPLLPDQVVSVSVTTKKESLLGFTCYVADEVICSGQLRYQS